MSAKRFSQIGVGIRAQSDMERVRSGWRLWHEYYQHYQPDPGYVVLIDYCYCLEHKTVHDVDLSYKEMAAIDRHCDPQKHIRLFVEEGYEQ